MKQKKVDFGNSEKALKSFPIDVLEKFIQDLVNLSHGEPPLSKVKAMKGLGNGVCELIKNGKPAYRCVYVVKGDVIHILHAFSKTSDGTDKKHEDVIKLRFKAL